MEMYRHDPGVTAELAKCIVNARYENMSFQAIENAKIGTLDALGNMLAGATQPIGKLLKNFIQVNDCGQVCTVVGMGTKNSDFWAAFANGSTCRSMDFDAAWPGHHPFGANLPPALALTEKLALSGKRLLEALIIGIETQHRIYATAATGANFLLSTAYGRSTVGVLPAAACAAKLLGLDERKTQHALGIAAARAGGIDSTGSMCNPGDSGHAASMGLLAATLAAQGFTGRENAIEEPYGFRQYMGNDVNLELITKEFANPWELERGVALERYSCQGGTYSTIETIMTMYEERPWKPHDIDSIEVVIKRIPHFTSFNYYTIHNTNPRSGTDGRFSLPYIAAVAALDGKIVIDSFSDERRYSADVVAMLPKVKIMSDQVRQEGAKWDRSKVTIRFKDDSIRTAEGGRPPAMNDDERIEKFIDCAQRVITKAEGERVVELVHNLDKLENTKELFALLIADHRS